MGSAITRRRFLVGTAATAVVGPTLWAPPARAAAPPTAPHLMYGADARHQLALSWSTAGNVRRPLVDIGVDDRYGLTLPAEGRSAPGVDTVYHHVRVDRLRPGTEYRYRIRHDGGPAVTGRFRTAPAVARPFRFATFGDMGVGPAAAANMAQLAQARPELVFVVGDLCYADASGGTGVLALPYDPTTWDAWFEQIRPSAAAVPWMTTVGNHEMERDGGELGYDGYLARFTPPRNGARGGPVTYSFRHGNVGFVALDGNDASFEIDRNRGYLGAAQDAWLDGTLAALRRDPAVDFIVVGFHNCMYCSNALHGSDGGNRSRWEPLFDRHQVDLVVNGHNHCWERTHPVRSGAPVTEAPADSTIDSSAGTTYLTAGGAGQAEYPTVTHPVSYVVEERGLKVPESAAWSAVRHPHHSIAIVDVGPGTMRITGVAKSGEVIDRVTLRR